MKMKSNFAGKLANFSDYTIKNILYTYKNLKGKLRFANLEVFYILKILLYIVEILLFFILNSAKL